MSQATALISIPDPEEENLGPAMRACTMLERRYVIALCETGAHDHTRALEMAGSGCTTRDSLRNTAMQMWRRPRVQEAMKEESWKRMNGFGLMAVSNVIDLARSSRDEKVRLKANLELMNRTGMNVIQKIDVRHTDVSKTDDELVRRMVDLVKRNPAYIDMVPDPIRPQVIALLPAPRHPVIDVEAIPVERDPDADIFGE